MSVALARHGFGTDWKDILLDRYEGFYPNMSDYHMHEYYEISLILSGNVNVLLSDMAESSAQSKIVLLRPYTPHYIFCEPDLLYRRRNILFGPEFLADYVPEWRTLRRVFGKNGSVLKITPEQCQEYLKLVQDIEQETSLFRKRLLLLYFLSLVTDNMQENGSFAEIPSYVTEALSYIGSHYSERIVAADLADDLQVGRTTLMTAFKKYTGTTLHEYLARCRLKRAVAMLQSGRTEQQTAEECGFGDPCNLIRCFKRHFGMTPMQYIASKQG